MAATQSLPGPMMTLYLSAAFCHSHVTYDKVNQLLKVWTWDGQGGRRATSGRGAPTIGQIQAKEAHAHEQTQ